MSETKVRKKKKLNIVTIILSVILFAGGSYFLYRAYLEFQETAHLKEQIAQAEKLLAEIKKENVDLMEQKTKLEDPEYVKSYARGIYMLSKEGEQIFYLPSEDE